MNRLSTFKYFAQAAIVPVLYTFVSGLVIFAFNDTPQVSEYFSDNYSFEMWWLTLLACLSVFMFFPIFLNKMIGVASNVLLSGLAWFLLPVIFFIMIGRVIFTDSTYYSNDILFNHILSILVVYLSMLTFSFYLFRKNLKKTQ